MFKKIFAIFIIGILFFGITGCSKNAEKSVMRIGFQTIPNTEAIAKANGWHEETMKNTKIEWYSFDSGRDVNTALASGSIDIGLLGSTLIANGISQGLDYKVIWLADVIGDNEALAVKKDSGIKSMADLKGKTIAVTFGSTTQYTLLGALKTNNIDPSELKIVDMQPPDMLAAWKRGDIDGGYVWQPTLQQMLDDNGSICISSKDLVEKGIITADVIVVRKEFTAAHPDLVEKYLASQIRAVELYRTQPELAAAAVAREFNISQKEALDMMKQLVWLSGAEQVSGKYLGSEGSIGNFAMVLKDTAQFLQEQNIIKSAAGAPAFAEAIKPEFIEKQVRGL